MLTNCAHPFEYMHVFVSAILFLILFVFVLFQDTSPYLKFVVGFITSVTFMFLAIITYNHFASKGKKYIIHKLDEGPANKQEQHWVKQFEETCKSIMMEKRLKQMESRSHEFHTEKFYNTSLYQLRRQYHLKQSQHAKSGSLFYSAELVFGDSKKLVSQNFSLKSNNLQAQREDQMLKKLGLNLNKKGEALQLVKNFMQNSFDDVFFKIEKTIYQTNEILIENFGVQLTHPHYPIECSITIVQLEELLRIYRKCKTLPKEYLMMAKRKQNLDKVMKSLEEKMQILQIIVPFPEKNIPLNLVIFILQETFKKQKIIVEKSNQRRGPETRIGNEHIITVHLNHNLCLQSCPQFRTEKTVIFSLIFMLNLMKRHFITDSNILRTLSKYCK